MTIPPALVIFGAVVIALIVAGAVRSCEEKPEVDHGVEVLKGGIEQ